MKLLCFVQVLLALMAVSHAADHVWLTIYDGNYAVVRDVRTFDLPKGESEIRFGDISRMILDDPVRVKGDGLIALEQNFQYHRLNDELLLQQSLGKKMEFLMKKGDTLSGALLGQEGAENDSTARFVVQQGVGAIRTLRRVDVRDYRYPTAPLDFQIKPTFTFKVQATEAGTHEVEAAYQVQGLDWGAHYLLDLSGNDSAAVLSGWAIVSNSAGRAFEHARVTLVTGQGRTTQKRLRITTDERMADRRGGRPVSHIANLLSRDTEAMAYQAPAVKMDVAAKEMAVTYERGEHEQLFNLQFYTLPLETSLPDGAEKEFNLFAPTTIKTSTRYEYSYWKSPTKVGVYVNTKNTDSVGLGTPLPAGPVKIYRTRTGGIAEDVGEDRLSAVAVNEPLRIRVGYAEGLSVQRKLLKAGASTWTNKKEEQWEVRIRNDRDTETKVMIQDQFPEKWKVVESSHAYTKTSEHSLEIAVTIPSETEAVVTYTVRTWREWK